MSTVVLPPRWEQVRLAAQAIADDVHAPDGEREAARGRIAAIEERYGQAQRVAEYAQPYVDTDALFAHAPFAEGDTDWTTPPLTWDELRELFDRINHEAVH